MIVLGNKNMSEQAEQEHKKSFEDLFKLEVDAYCDYKQWREETDDIVLEMALEEIMMDEYLHAKFLRDYMIDKEMYSLSADDPHEKKFWKIHKKLFRD